MLQLYETIALPVKFQEWTIIGLRERTSLIVGSCFEAVMIVDQGLEVSDLNCMAGVASAFHACVSAQLLRGELSEELLNLFIALKLVLGDSEDLIGLQLGHEPTLDAQPLVSHTLPAAVDILLFRVHFSALFFKLANLHECISSGQINR
jgi:hypothetical protein